MQSILSDALEHSHGDVEVIVVDAVHEADRCSSDTLATVAQCDVAEVREVDAVGRGLEQSIGDQFSDGSVGGVTCAAQVAGNVAGDLRRGGRLRCAARFSTTQAS